MAPAGSSARRRALLLVSDMGGSPRYRGRRLGLALAALGPLAFAAVGHALGHPAALAVDLAAGAMVLAGLFLLGEGLRAEDEWLARPSARRPRLPLKLAAALLVGLAAALAAMATAGFGVAAALGALVASLHVAAFGADPLRDKVAPGAEPGAALRAAGHAARGRQALTEIEATVEALGDPALARAAERLGAAVRHLLDLLDSQPETLVLLRAHAGPILTGARDATLRLAELWPGAGRAAAREEWIVFAADLTRSCAEQTHAARMMAGHRMKLEIEAVRAQMAARARKPGDSERG